MKTIILIFYNYYNKGATKMIAYESTILGLVTVLFLNLFAIANFLNLSLVLNILDGTSRMVKYGLMFIFFVLPAYIILSKVVPKEELTDEKSNAPYKKKYGWMLFFYIIISIILLIVSIKFRNR